MWLLKQAFKTSLGVAAGILSGPFAPLGGAAGYTLAEFILNEIVDEDNCSDVDELSSKYLTKFCIFALGGLAGGIAGEALGGIVGEHFNLISDLIPGDQSEAIANFLVQNETFTNSCDKFFCAVNDNSLLSPEQKVKILYSSLNYVEKGFDILLNDGVLEEILGREAVKNITKKQLVQWLNDLGGGEELGYA
ncbi:hypothetical protein PN473_02910 [Dolichospermum circinale CS-545/17]|nr:hypothetical protein [Dolichospermum circinale CS-545/17]